MTHTMSTISASAACSGAIGEMSTTPITDRWKHRLASASSSRMPTSGSLQGARYGRRTRPIAAYLHRTRKMRWQAVHSRAAHSRQGCPRAPGGGREPRGDSGGLPGSGRAGHPCRPLLRLGTHGSSGRARSMRLLIDNQLPEALGGYLTDQGFECQHVRRVGLRMATDEAIWEYARKHGMAIVTMDEDFAALAAQRASVPPQVVWVRLGNTRKAALIEAFGAVLPELRELLAQGHGVVEVR